MGLGGFSEKDININTGGSADWLPAMMMNASKSGDLGGNNIMWLVLIILLGGGCGRLGFGANATAGQELGLFNATNIDNVKTAIAGSTGTIINAIDKGIASVTATVTAGFVEQTANLTNQINNTRNELASGFVRTENGLQLLNSLTQSGFREQERSFAALSLQNCKDNGTLLNAISCSTQSLKDNMNNGFNAITAQNMSTMNFLTKIECQMTSQHKDLSCQIANSTRDIIQNAKDIASAQAAADAHRKAAEDAARITKLEFELSVASRREYENNNANISSQMSAMVAAINSMANKMGGSGTGTGTV